MRQPVIVALCLAGTLGLSACNRTTDAEVQRAIDSVNVIDATNLNDIMLTVGDPAEAVAYFAKASSENPDRVDLKRGLAKSLIRAQRPADAPRSGNRSRPRPKARWTTACRLPMPISAPTSGPRPRRN